MRGTVIQVLTKELINCTADVERTKPERINLQSGIPTVKRQSKQQMSYN